MNKLKNIKNWFALILLIGSFQLNAGIDFQNISFKAAKEKAKKEGKLVFIDAYATWCGPCKWMSANVFVDEEVGNYFNQHFISLKIDMEKEAGPEINEAYEITAYPSLLVVDPSGKVVRKKVGALEVDDFLSFGKYAVHPETVPLLSSSKKYNAGNRSFDFLIEHLVNNIEEDTDYDYLIPVIYENFPVDSMNTFLGFSFFSSFPSDFLSLHTQYFLTNVNLFRVEYENTALELYAKIYSEAYENGQMTKEKIKARYSEDFKSEAELVEALDGYFAEL